MRKPWVLCAMSAAVFSLAQETTFRVRVDVVTVPVVVRDNKGNAVAHLAKADFALADNGKPQVISNFAEVGNAETSVSGAAVRESTETGNPAGLAAKASAAQERFLAFLFDDIHMAFADLAKTRSAAEKTLPALLDGHTRVAIGSTSGRVRLGFTNDPKEIAQAVARISPNAMTGSEHAECPDLGYSMAERIVNQSDRGAFEAALGEAVKECHQTPQGAEMLVRSAAQRSLAIHEIETRTALEALRDIVQGMLVLPGERSVVLVSPGFYVPRAESRMHDLLDRAARHGIVIQALEAQGLVLLPGFSAEQQGLPSHEQSRYKEEERRAAEDTLAQLAEASGGRVFKNNNDYASAFRRLSARAEIVYLLGFTPADGLTNGAYHQLKVTLTDHKEFEVQARRGYWARPAEDSQQEMKNALFSHEVVRDLPMSMEWSAVEGSAGRKLRLLFVIDSKQIRFQKKDGRNRDQLSILYGLFDAGGNALAISTQVIPLDFSDDDLMKKLAGRLGITKDIELKPGSRILRVVLRDEEGQMSLVESAVGK